MRIINPFLKTEYILQELIGDGLTSRVYKAIRRDRGLKIEQTVALKILNSKKEVSALKNEIKILTKVSSNHCVRLLGWENHSLGPTLVLEYLEGVSLSELFVFIDLPRDLIDEIVAQVQEGLRDLAHHYIWHGDLSPRNIFITREGTIKLLDFGFSGRKPEKNLFATPQFLSPEVWLGKETSLAGDMFSLGLLREDLIDGTLIVDEDLSFWKQRSLDKINKNSLLASQSSERRYLPLVSHKDRRLNLGDLVMRALDNKERFQKTEKLAVSQGLNKKTRTLNPVKFIHAALCVLTFTFVTELQPSALPSDRKDFTKQVSHSSNTLSLDVRSHRWAAVRLFENSSGRYSREVYAPFSFTNLKPGKYEIQWRSPKGIERKRLALDRSRRVLLE